MPHARSCQERDRQLAADPKPKVRNPTRLHQSAIPVDFDSARVVACTWSLTTPQACSLLPLRVGLFAPGLLGQATAGGGRLVRHAFPGCRQQNRVVDGRAFKPLTLVSVSERFWDIRSGSHEIFSDRVTTWPRYLELRILPNRKFVAQATSYGRPDHGESNRRRN